MERPELRVHDSLHEAKQLDAAQEGKATTQLMLGP